MSDWKFIDPHICGYDPEIHGKKEWPHPGPFPFKVRRPMLYLNEGLSFEKQPDSGVRIVKRSGNDPESPVIFDHVLDAIEWASVIAAMGASGEEVAKFAEAPIPILD